MPITQSVNPSAFASKPSMMRSQDFFFDAGIGGVKTENSSRTGGIYSPSEEMYAKLKTKSDKPILKSFGGSNSGSVDE